MRSWFRTPDGRPRTYPGPSIAGIRLHYTPAWALLTAAAVGTLVAGPAVPTPLLGGALVVLLVYAHALTHELGHAAAAHRVGLKADAIVLYGDGAGRVRFGDAAACDVDVPVAEDLATTAGGLLATAMLLSLAVLAAFAARALGTPVGIAMADGAAIVLALGYVLNTVPLPSGNDGARLLFYHPGRQSFHPTRRAGLAFRRVLDVDEPRGVLAHLQRAYWWAQWRLRRALEAAAQAVARTLLRFRPVRYAAAVVQGGVP